MRTEDRIELELNLLVSSVLKIFNAFDNYENSNIFQCLLHIILCVEEVYTVSQLFSYSKIVRKIVLLFEFCT